MTHSQPIKVVIADDHEIYRDGLKMLLSKISEVTLIGEAENGVQLMDAVTKLKPDVVLTDIVMPVMDGITAVKNILQTMPAVAIVSLSMYNEENYITDMLEAGAAGYLLKNASKDEIREAIISVYHGKTYFCSQTSAKLTRLIANSKYTRFKKEVVFSDKEKEIITLICQEKTNKEIGEQLFMSPRTVEGYRMRIQEKINVRGTVGIVLFAIKHHLYKLEE